MKYFTSLYNSFLISLLISLILFTSEWIEMRVNIGLLFFGIWIITFTILCVVSRKIDKIGFVFSISNLIICFLVSFILYGIKRLAIVPASIIREGLHITSISFASINIVISIFLVVGLIFLFITHKNKKSL